MPDELDSLAYEVLEGAKTDLLINLHFMSPIFSALKFLPIKNASLATDGTHIRYDSKEILKMFKVEPTSVARMLLHISLHNVFLHSFPKSDTHQMRWDLSCDIAVENIINELNLPVSYSERSSRQESYVATIKEDIQVLTAESLYNYFEDRKISDYELEEIRKDFIVDDHSSWYLFETESRVRRQTKQLKKESSQNVSRAAGALDSKDGTQTEEGPEKDAEFSHKSSRGMSTDDIVQKEAPKNAKKAIGKRLADTINLDRSKEQWKNAAYEMGIQLDSYIQHWGTESSNLRMNLKNVTRKRQDYKEFLRKFASTGEELKVNDDEFDYVFYCYGLSLYKNLPLIEPLEYVEEHKIRDFVIAIDTSSSTKDGQVRKFIEKTYSILREQTSFSVHMNVLIIQCDAAITEMTKISSPEDIERYLENLEIKGLGGTDFRPVFRYVDEQIAKGELSDLKGLIYFTDGQGSFPKQAPDYDVAFIFADEQSLDTEVPSWAMKLVLQIRQDRHEHTRRQIRN